MLIHYETKSVKTLCRSPLKTEVHFHLCASHLSPFRKRSFFESICVSARGHVHMCAGAMEENSGLREQGVLLTPSHLYSSYISSIFNRGRMPLVFATLIILEYSQVMCRSAFVGEPLVPQERTCSSVAQFVLREWAGGLHYFCPPLQQDSGNLTGMVW